MIVHRWIALAALVRNVLCQLVTVENVSSGQQKVVYHNIMAVEDECTNMNYSQENAPSRLSDVVF
jgi:hypothetical protein